MSSEEEAFRQLYERHVGYVRSGDLRASLGDMVPDVIPAVFEGVDVPRARPAAATIVGVYRRGEHWVGETIYDTSDGRIGLRSIWHLHQGQWKAAELENFDTSAAAVEAVGP
jgi:hypothetical protein